MTNNTVLAEILSSKSHKIRKEWYQDRIDKQNGINVADKNLKIYYMIDRLNKKIGG